MTDPLQRTSTVPLPAFQTEAGAHDPLPVNSPKYLDRLHDAARKDDEDKDRDRFEAYLNQGGISVLAKNGDGTAFDTASHITKNSIYSLPDDKTQF